ncbi:hypothetical protein EMIHUDRAFT_447556 [Emiliania huxleyi CCMP1516]|uniref:Thioredoxin domain-containing protein n=2 Tax=Emiliania huxleyi TaxID=2903 RepID=A0A0D3L210_EMIH1|nr:hypothetical protein EMIHUDRAFT_447556 [Emiliania huxleyi CCMP1516]EOD42045.1 hypothetical protein EMIHUDRAFT_447556 [Emiliania huxleyi CCMP1516]|eukprot:XP_005794474.1 hypothetical protein EMIHUDRAFT_447556 [Emiliania huxleyi CCMP1516]
MSVPLLLTQHNFSSALHAHSPLLVLYLAAGSLPPEPPGALAAAAQLLGHGSGAVALCDDEVLASSAGVVALPALRLHHHAVDGAEVYKGNFVAWEMAAFVRRHARSEPQEVNTGRELAAEAEAAEGGALVLFSSDSSDAPAARRALAALAADGALRRTGFIVAPAGLFSRWCPPPLDSDAGPCEPTAEDERLHAAASLPPTRAGPRPSPSSARVVLLRRGEAVGFEGDVRDEAQLRAFLRRHHTPLLAEASHTARAAHTAVAHSQSCLLCDQAAHTARVGAALFGWIDANRHRHHLPVSARIPALAADHANLHYAFCQAGAYHGELYAPVMQWARSVAAGSLPPTLRSEEPPLDNLGPVVRLVGSTLEPLALRSAADVLLCVHAPWDEVDVLPELEVFARLWAHERRVRVASIDVSRNDLPRRLRLERTPALLFFRGDEPASAAPRDFSAVASRDALMEHVLEHTSIKGLERPVDTEQLRELVGALPRLAADAQRLLQENERLSAELDKARARLDAHAGGPSAGS